MCAVAFAERRRRLSSRSLSALAWACELFCGCVDDENLACFRSYIFVLRLVLWPSRTKLGYRNSWCQKKSCSRCLANTEHTRDPCRDAHRTIPAGLLMSLHNTIASLCFVHGATPAVVLPAMKFSVVFNHAHSCFVRIPQSAATGRLRGASVRG